jgi:2OG-Fe(II) oxygenase superfamily
VAFQQTVEVREVERFGGEDLRRIAEGRLGALVIPGFLSDPECQRILANVDSERFQQYSPRHYSTLALRIGPSLNEHRLLGKVATNYWDAVEESWDLLRRSPLSLTLHDRFMDLLRQAWEGGVREARHEGRSAYWGIMRRMEKGTLVHWDDLRSEFPTAIFGDMYGGQISVNVFLEAPEDGGRLCVWSTPREEWHEKARVQYGYDRALVVPEEPDVYVMPKTGDAVFFGSFNYHAVESVRSGNRVAFSLFMGISADGELLLWS